MKPPIVRPAAAADIDDAYRWYERQQVGLGEEFLAAANGTKKGTGYFSGDSQKTILFRPERLSGPIG